MINLRGASPESRQLAAAVGGSIFGGGEDAEVLAGFLSFVPSPEFVIVGYGLSTDGWLDPIAFLKAHGADINPAAFELADRRRAKGRIDAGAKSRQRVDDAEQE